MSGLKMIEKQWGWTVPEVLSPLCEVHRIDVRAGGHCSWHKHDRKHNVFTVVRGRMLVEVRDEPNEHGEVVNSSTTHTLEQGDTYDVPPGLIHRFICPVPTTAVEVYYPASVSQQDIVRFSQGGVEE